MDVLARAGVGWLLGGLTVVFVSLIVGCSSDDNGDVDSSYRPPVESAISGDGTLSVVGPAPFPAPDGEVVPWRITHLSCDSCLREGELVVRDGRIDLEVDISDWPAGQIVVAIEYATTGATQQDSLTFATDYQLDWRP